MSKKSETKQEEKNTKTPPYAWDSLWPEGRIKTLIHTQDANAGIFRRQTLQMLSTCSALLLRRIVQQSCHLRSQDKSNQPTPTSSSSKAPGASAIVLSAKDIQRSVAQDDSLGFLEEVLEEAVESDDGKLAKIKTIKSKRKQAPAAGVGNRNGDTTNPSSSKRPKNSAKIPKVSNEWGNVDQEHIRQAIQQVSQEAVPNSRTTDKIVLDEEDYDE